MIHAGKLDRLITIERKTETIADSGAVSQTWAVIATVRAERVQLTAEEFLTGFGEAEQTKTIFRVRYLAGISTADRVVLDGVAYEIDQIVELGRRRGLVIRTGSAV